jgi:hypothetical protein
MLSRVSECLEHEFALATHVLHALGREYARAPPLQECLKHKFASAPRVRERVERELAVGGPVFTACVCYIHTAPTFLWNDEEVRGRSLSEWAIGSRIYTERHSMLEVSCDANQSKLFFVV